MSIYAETLDEGFDRFEQVGKNLATGYYAVSRLVDLDVTTISAY